jgi:hypothetical protein
MSVIVVVSYFIFLVQLDNAAIPHANKAATILQSFLVIPLS